MKIVILQPHIPHYREDFFKDLNKKVSLDVFCYEEAAKVEAEKFKRSSFNNYYLGNLKYGPFLLYNFFKLFDKKYHVFVLMLHFGHLSTWFLLLTKKIHRKKVILWGQGISVKRYLKEETKPSLLLKLMIYLSDGVWFYTKKELTLWEKLFPNKNMISLNNTISDLKPILERNRDFNKIQLKMKYKITQEKCFIFCARFTNPHRRVDLLLSAINALDSNKFGFIIIGDGHYKPNFSSYKNVFDFGAVYDLDLKNELFDIADIYFQPGWIGLSVVEAMAYGKPIFTFKRSEEVLQCVEYYYIKNNVNGYIFDSLDSFINTVKSINEDKIMELGENAKKDVAEVLTMNNMVECAFNNIFQIKNY
jgi:glycosyltransferase involved in cell wall biosynthesis